MPHVSYAGVPLLLEDPEHVFQRWVDQTLPLTDLTLFGNCDAWHAENKNRSAGVFASRVNGSAVPAVSLPTFNYTTFRPPQWKINSLWWPTGATRHAIGLFLASDEEIDSIAEQLRNNATGSGFDGAAKLIMDEVSKPAASAGRTRLEIDGMYMLPWCNLTARQSNPNNACASLICLVDQRYFWPQKTSGNFAVDSLTTWEDLFDQLGTLLGTSIVYDEIPDAYGMPDPDELSRLYDNPAAMLDAISASVGHRVCLDYDGTAYSLNYISSREVRDIGNSYANGFVHLAGGANSHAIRGTDYGASAWGVFPEKLRTVFPIRNFFQLTDKNIRIVDVAASDVMPAEVPTTQETAKTIHTTALADYSGSGTEGYETSEYLSNNPANLSEMQDLAELIADDFYNYIGDVIDLVADGIYRWDPTGFDDWIWYHAGCQRKEEIDGNGDYSYYTRVASQPINFGVSSQLSQLLEPVPALELTACGDENISVRVFDTRDYTEGDLLSDRIGDVAKILGACFHIDQLADSTADAIRLPVASIHADCEACIDPGCGLTVVDGKVQVDPSIAGANLTWDALNCRLDATGEPGPPGPPGEPGNAYEAGCGIIVDTEGDPDTISIDPTLAGDGLIFVPAYIDDKGNSDPGDDESIPCMFHVLLGCGLKFDEEDENGNKAIIFDPELFGDGLLYDSVSGECSLTVKISDCLDFNEDGEIIIKRSELAGNGLIAGDGDCALAVGAGCGILVSANEVSINRSDLIGINPYNGLTAGFGECDLAVKVAFGSCGIYMTPNGLAFDPSYLPGDALYWNLGCQIHVRAGCGLRINTGLDQVEIDPNKLGDGLWQDGDCNLHVDYGCGLDIEGGVLVVDLNQIAGDGLQVDAGSGEDCDELSINHACSLAINAGGELKVQTDFPACGLKWVDDETECQIMVDNEDLAEGSDSYLEPNGECGLKVKNELIDVITEITSLTLEGGELKLKYKKRSNVRVLEAGPEVDDEVSISTTDECP